MEVSYLEDLMDGNCMDKGLKIEEKEQGSEWKIKSIFDLLGLNCL